ncbi:hypothetical protein B1218_39250, partial [Pseudomonas ogarae]
DNNTANGLSPEKAKTYEIVTRYNDDVWGGIDLLLMGSEFAADGAPFAFPPGVLCHAQIKSGASAALVTGALDSFVRAAAIELPRGL